MPVESNTVYIYTYRCVKNRFARLVLTQHVRVYLYICALIKGECMHMAEAAAEVMKRSTRLAWQARGML